MTAPPNAPAERPFRTHLARTRLDELLTETGPNLISVSARSRLTTAIAMLAETTAELALECHFASRGERADLVARVHASERDQMLGQPGLPEPLEGFLRAWANPTHALARLPFIELEFDLDGDKPAHAPWIGPANEPLVRQGVSAIAASKADRRLDDWPSYELAIAIMTTLGLDGPAWRDRVRQCFAALPRTGCINHFTVLDARPGASNTGIRMIASLPRYELARFLKDVNFRGSIARLEHVVDRYLPHRGRVDLDLNVSLTDMSSRTAIYSEFVAPRGRNSMLQDLCRTLDEDGLLERPILDDLRAWIERVDGDLTRALSVKVGLDGERSFAKAYLQSRGV